MSQVTPLRTKSGLPRHCYWETDRHGKRRVRFRKGAISAYLSGIPWSERFMRQYAVALERLQAQASNVGAERVIAGTFDALCVSYYGSPDFHRLRPSTQRVRRNIIERLRYAWGKFSLRDFQRQTIEHLMGRMHETPQAANNMLKVLRVLFAHAVDIEMIASNPAIGVKRYKSEGEGFPTWSEAEVAQFKAAYSIGTKERLALTLLLYTGQRVGDVVRMGVQHVKDRWITVRQEKTDTPLVLEMHPELVRILAAVPHNNLTFLVTERGAAFSAAGFSNWFGKCCRAAGLMRCTAHGLRKLALTRRANAGASTEMLKAFGGHKSSREVEDYVRAADQVRLDAQGLELQLRAEREQKSSEPSPVRKDQG